MAKRRIYVGTSGGTHDDWTGPFYPRDAKGARRLESYADKFNTVEVKATCYRLPVHPVIGEGHPRLAQGGW